MFGRKKNKEDKNKKRHKHGMTPAEISKLEEVGIRRGFFSKKSLQKRDKEEAKGATPTATGADQQSDEFQASSVLERATNFGTTVQRKTSTSRFPLVSAPPTESPTHSTNYKHPIPPARRKSSQTSADHHPYDVPKSTVKKSHHVYDTPHSWGDGDSISRDGSSESSPVRLDGPFRQVLLVKRSSGDFGVSLRRSVVPSKNNKDEKKVIYFAEPGAAMLADVYSAGDSRSRLYPGDRLIEIDGVNVENASREEIVRKIKNAGDRVTFMVQTMADKLHKQSDSNWNSEETFKNNVNGIANHAKDDTVPKLPATKKKSSDPKNRKTPVFGESSNSRCSSISETLTAEEARFQVDDDDSFSDALAVKAISEVSPNELHASAAHDDDSIQKADLSTFEEKEFEDALNSLQAGIEQKEATSKNDETSEETKVSNPPVVNQDIPPIVPVKPKTPEVWTKPPIAKPNPSTDKKPKDQIRRRSKTPEIKTKTIELFPPKTPKSKAPDKPEAKTPQHPNKVAGSEPEKVVILPPVANGNSNDVAEIPSNENQEINSLETKIENFSDEQVKEDDSSKLIVPMASVEGFKWVDKQKVWMINDKKLCSGNIVELENKSPAHQPHIVEGRKAVRLEDSKDVVLVLEDKVDLANESQYARSSDISTLRHLNDCSMIHTLTHRFDGGLHQTFVGPHLVSTVLHHALPQQTNYSKKVMETYKGSRLGDAPPHIYAMAQQAHQRMMASGTDQCLLNLGHSGAGKTFGSKQILNYLASTTISSNNSVLSVDKIQSVVHLVDSFGSAATRRCQSASRCVGLYNLDFDRTGQMVSASVQSMLLERTRLYSRPEGEGSFNVFYQLLYGASTSLRKEMFLLDLEQENNPILHKTSSTDESDNFAKGFANLQQSMETLGFKPDEIKAVLHVVAACMHLGVAGAEKVSSDRFQFANADSAQKAASLLGVTVEKLSKTIFQQSRGQHKGTMPRTGSISRTGSVSSLKGSLSPNIATKNMSNMKSVPCELLLQAFVMSLYAELFTSVTTLINRSLSSTHHAQNTIHILDAPGYQQPPGGSTFYDLMYNYLQDSLHVLLHNVAFISPRDRYEQEGIDNEIFIPDESYSAAVDVIDKPPVIGSSGGKGLLWVLDEESSAPGSSDETFIERMLLSATEISDASVVKGASDKLHFSVLHQGGGAKVEYNVRNWVNFAKFKSMDAVAIEAMHESKKKHMQELFGGGEFSYGSVAGLRLDGGNTLRRATSFRNAWAPSGGAAATKKTSCMIIKRQVDGLLDLVKRSHPNFILSCSLSHLDPTNIVDCSDLHHQLQGFQLLHIARSIKQGYPENMVLFDFRTRFDVLLRNFSSDLPTNTTAVALLEDREAAEKILQLIDLSRSQFRIGNSQVFFRLGVLNRIEDKRNEKVSAVITLFQANIRGYLARRRLGRRKVQDVAVRCIQRNIRKFMAIRQWPWWRLLTKVLPLVEVVRTEEELHEIQAELSNLKEKYDRVVGENDDYKTANAKYETKMQEMLLHLEEERSSCLHATQLLEHESKEKSRLDKMVKDSQMHQSSLQKQVESMEVELAEKRLLYADHHSITDSDEEMEDIEYKAKYERACREFKFDAKQKKQEYEDSLEEWQAKNKMADKKLSQALEEVDEQRRLEAQVRKKLHRTVAELSDARIHLEETSNKNHELEKKQRKFDSELYALQADVTDLRVAKDRVLREKDALQMEKNSTEKELMERDDEVDSLRMKIERIEEELEDASGKDSDDRQQVNALKRQIRELDSKVRDQEEELEEQATSIHHLEQTRDRLEMSGEQARQQRAREVESKEDELEEMRSSYQKKIKQLELQLDELEEERASMSKHRHEVEQELDALKRDAGGGHDPESVRRLRRDLKRYKALLSDAQTMIEHLKADVVSKQQMRQLKAQLEESEYTCGAAVKAKKSIELELEDVQSQLDEVSTAKQDAESRVSALQREVYDLRSKMEEDAEDSQETIRKYRSLVSIHSDQQSSLTEASTSLEELKAERATLNDKVASLQSQLEYLEQNTVDKASAQRLDNKAKDLETKLEFQKTANRRLEVQVGRLKENNEKTMGERDSHKQGEQREKEQAKQFQRQLRDSKNEQGDLLKREQEALKKKHELQMELDESEKQLACLQADLKLAFKRISHLQLSLEEVEESDASDEDFSGSSESDEDDLFLGSRASWRGRLSTTGSRTSSSRLDDQVLPPPGESRLSKPSKKISKKKRKKKAEVNEEEEDDLSPLKDSMSDAGRALFSDIERAESVRSKFVESRSSPVEFKPSRELDSVSSQLADENPSVILYGGAKNIAKSLGLASSRSFQALNENLRVVKSRQNLSEPQKARAALDKKIQKQISQMRSRARSVTASDVSDDDVISGIETSFSDADFCLNNRDEDSEAGSETNNRKKKAFKSRFLSSVQHKAKIRAAEKAEKMREMQEVGRTKRAASSYSEERSVEDWSEDEDVSLSRFGLPSSSWSLHEDQKRYEDVESCYDEDVAPKHRSRSRMRGAKTQGSQQELNVRSLSRSRSKMRESYDPEPQSVSRSSVRSNRKSRPHREDFDLEDDHRSKSRMRGATMQGSHPENNGRSLSRSSVRSNGAKNFHDPKNDRRSLSRSRDQSRDSPSGKRSGDKNIFSNFNSSGESSSEDFFEDFENFSDDQLCAAPGGQSNSLDSIISKYLYRK